MGDLNPNRANVVLYLNDAGGAINVIDDGVSNVVVAQLGNLVTLQLKDTVTGAWAAVTDEVVFETVLTTADPVIARIVPGASGATVPFTGVNDTSFQETVVVIVTVVASKLRFTIKPPPLGWSDQEGTDDLNVEGSQIAYAAAPQDGRDYVAV
jgi:hypothetical protein